MKKFAFLLFLLPLSSQAGALCYQGKLMTTQVSGVVHDFNDYQACLNLLPKFKNGFACYHNQLFSESGLVKQFSSDSDCEEAARTAVSTQ